MKAIITGVNGQDGSYLAELLVSKGYNVVGLVRKHSTPCLQRLVNVVDKITIEELDITDQGGVLALVQKHKPDEIYNLAAQSFVPVSWSQPAHTNEVNCGGVINFLEAIRMSDKRIKFYQASTSEMFGKVVCTPQDENTPFYPRSPYGISKLAAHWMTINYRESFGIYTASGILFNHESPRRGSEFVTKKIIEGVVAIVKKRKKRLELGNLDAKRDWGYAGDYVDAMWRMLQHDYGDTYVIGTGITTSIKEFCKKAFNCARLNWEDFVVSTDDNKRPAEVDLLLSNPTKARVMLGWRPTVTLDALIEMMYWAELKRQEI